jgi:hypothetical protein
MGETDFVGGIGMFVVLELSVMLNIWSSCTPLRGDDELRRSTLQLCPPRSKGKLA